MKRQDNNKLKTQIRINYIGFAFFIAMAFCLSACDTAPLALLDKVRSGVEQVKDSSYQTAARSIDGYCDKVPLSKRQDLRYQVNSRTTKGDILITCESDK